jgi:hypothetical protein
MTLAGNVRLAESRGWTSCAIERRDNAVLALLTARMIEWSGDHPPGHHGDRSPDPIMVPIVLLGWSPVNQTAGSSMRQSRRTNTGNRRDTLARRWRPWFTDDPLPLSGGPPVARPVVGAAEAKAPDEKSPLGDVSESPSLPLEAVRQD